MVLWFSFVGCDYFSIDGGHMKLESLSYTDTCKIIQKVGAVYSSGFSPWVPFVRSDKCKFIRAEDRGRGWGQLSTRDPFQPIRTVLTSSCPIRWKNSENLEGLFLN